MIHWPLIGCCIVFLLNQCFCELRQFKKEKNYLQYITNFWNLNDLSYLFLNMLLLIFHIFDIVPLEQQRYIASISTVLMCIKIIDWLRLFDKTSFYISLINDTLHSIKSFMVIIFMCYMLFGTCLYIFSLNPDDYDIMVVHFGFWFFNAFQSAY